MAFDNRWSSINVVSDIWLGIHVLLLICLWEVKAGHNSVLCPPMDNRPEGRDVNDVIVNLLHT